MASLNRRHRAIRNAAGGQNSRPELCRVSWGINTVTPAFAPTIATHPEYKPQPKIRQGQAFDHTWQFGAKGLMADPSPCSTTRAGSAFPTVAEGPPSATSQEAIQPLDLFYSLLDVLGRNLHWVPLLKALAGLGRGCTHD